MYFAGCAPIPHSASNNQDDDDDDVEVELVVDVVELEPPLYPSPTSAPPPFPHSPRSLLCSPFSSPSPSPPREACVSTVEVRFSPSRRSFGPKCALEDDRPSSKGARWVRGRPSCLLRTSSSNSSSSALAWIGFGFSGAGADLFCFLCFFFFFLLLCCCLPPHDDDDDHDDHDALQIMTCRHLCRVHGAGYPRWVGGEGGLLLSPPVPLTRHGKAHTSCVFSPLPFPI